MTAALTHGLFWSLVNPVAARIAPPGQMGKAVAAVSFGSTLSMVVGSPLTTALGSAIGWRAATWVLGAAVVTSAPMSIVFAMPYTEALFGALAIWGAATGGGLRDVIVSLAAGAIVCG